MRRLGIYTAIILILSVPVLSPFTLAGTIYLDPELYEDGDFITSGGTIRRLAGLDATIRVVLRNSTNFLTVDGIHIRVIIRNDLGGEIFNKTSVTDNISVEDDFYLTLFEISGDVVEVGQYTIELIATTGVGVLNSLYHMTVTAGSSYEVAYPQSVTFMRYSIEMNEEVKCVVDVSVDAQYVTFQSGLFVLDFVNSVERLWNGTVVFTDIGEVEFTISIVDNFGVETVYDLAVYVVKSKEDISLPSLRVIESNDYHVTIVKTAEWFESQTYKEHATWHVNAEWNNNLIVDLSVAEPVIVDRERWGFWDYESNEIQVIMSGIPSDVGITYVLNNIGLEIKYWWSSIKIKGVNDWRNVWGLLGKGVIMNQESEMRVYDILNVNYGEVFGLYSAKKTLVAIY